MESAIPDITDQKPRIDFDAWFLKLQELAEEKDFPLGDKECYREFYDTGNTTAETLWEEISNI